MTKSDVDTESLGCPLTFCWPFERRGIGTQVLEVIDLLNVFELIPIHKWLSACMAVQDCAPIPGTDGY